MCDLMSNDYLQFFVSLQQVFPVLSQRVEHMGIVIKVICSLINPLSLV